ncbi:MAG: Holliday junction resolvase RuvX [Holosporaceae bacterium]|jgi:putative Holliday junction resolvase|nr:Holliday junction resolvase RuvX [Holosporaceae bacterium]
MIFFEANTWKVDVGQLIAAKSVVMGLDVGDKTVGIAISDNRIRIASGVTTIQRNETSRDFSLLLESVKCYKIGAVVFGWPLQMNGLPGKQCEKVLKFVEELSAYIPDADFVKWDERFSTKVVNNLMIKADLSRKRRKQVVDQSAAVYILQGAIDLLNRSLNGSLR